MSKTKSTSRMIISRTPVRISLFGGGTDYPAFYERHSGIVLGTTINKYTYVSVNTLSEFFEHNIRIGYSKTELVKKPEEIVHPSIRECLIHKNISGNLDIHIFSDLPAKTGLGSSSSFTVGFLNALYAIEGTKTSKQQLALEACHVEQKLIKENVGSQDQFHAAYGGLNVIEFNPNHINVRPVIISLEKLQLLENSLIIFYTGLTRFASDVVKEQIDKTKTKSNDTYLLQMRDMVKTAEDIISTSSEDDMIKDLGLLLDESWQLKKQLSSKISNSKIDESYSKAKKAGAYGGKLCGAGSGGFLAILAPDNKKSEIRENLKNLLEVDFKFENQGSTIIYMKD
ncbi:MAG: D-glycero-alpha-D-manno-heptose 7-phosphate kinase [Candidatus Anoxychlamydiales bacterium]|nr:D-glycero-alpha-D-manno-heptose 7-phosphate kinase [Candidatus Anoxychlamydiales bacterium]